MNKVTILILLVLASFIGFFVFAILYDKTLRANSHLYIAIDSLSTVILQKDLIISTQDAKIDSLITELEKPLLERLVRQVIAVESGGNPNAIGKKGEVGLMQIRGGSLCPVTNIEQGTAMLKALICRSYLLGDSTDYLQILHRSLTGYAYGWAGSNRYFERNGSYVSAYSSRVLRRMEELCPKRTLTR